MTGNTGPQGIQGLTGNTGPQGLTGNTGPQGDSAPSGNMYFWTGVGSTTNKQFPTLKFWSGKTTTSSGTSTFYITVDGTATGVNIFANLNNCHIAATSQFNTTNALQVPLTAIRDIQNPTGTGGTVRVYSMLGVLAVVASNTLKFNDQSITVYLQIYGD